jgi:hypothetical protein
MWPFSPRLPEPGGGGRTLDEGIFEHVIFGPSAAFAVLLAFLTMTDWYDLLPCA